MNFENFELFDFVNLKKIPAKIFSLQLSGESLLRQITFLKYGISGISSCQG